MNHINKEKNNIENKISVILYLFILFFTLLLPITSLVYAEEDEDSGERGDEDYNQKTHYYINFDDDSETENDNNDDDVDDDKYENIKVRNNRENEENRYQTSQVKTKNVLFEISTSNLNDSTKDNIEPKVNYIKNNTNINNNIKSNRTNNGINNKTPEKFNEIYVNLSLLEDKITQIDLDNDSVNVEVIKKELNNNSLSNSDANNEDQKKDLFQFITVFFGNLFK